MEKTGSELSKTAATFGPFQEAVNQQAYLKAGILGFAGAGKTYTAALMAKGIVERLKVKKPVFFVDTETGSDFLVPKFKEWEIPFFVSKSRAFTDLVDGVKAAEGNAAVLIIDSISHFWTELQRSYMKANNRKRLLFQDWGPLKETWAGFTDLYLNSRVHIVMCGRAGYEYDYFTDEAGAKVLEKTGTKMKAETDMGYEPSLLIEMIRDRRENQDKTVEAKLWDHVAIVLKDRTSRIEGQRFVNPTFDNFKPVFDYLNIGGEHVGVVTDKNSTKLFEKDSEENFYEKRRQKEILLAEIKGVLDRAHPGSTGEDKKSRIDLLFKAFGKHSKEAIEELSIGKLRDGLATIQSEIKKTDKIQGGKR